MPIHLSAALNPAESRGGYAYLFSNFPEPLPAQDPPLLDQLPQSHLFAFFAAGFAADFLSALPGDTGVPERPAADLPFFGKTALIAFA